MRCAICLVSFFVAVVVNADDKPDLQALIKQIRLSRDAKSRIKALEELGKLGPDAKEASQAIIEVMMERGPMVRQAASDALERVNLPLHGPVLKIVVDDAKRLTAVDELVGLEAEAKPTIPLLLAVFRTEMAAGGSSQIRTSEGVPPAAKVLQAMVRIAPEEKSVVQAVLDTITVKGAGGTGKLASSGGANNPIRLYAIDFALEMDKLDPKPLTKALMTATHDQIAKLKAIEALGELGPRAKEALPLLKKLKLDSEEKVRDAATASVERIDKE